MGVVHYPMVGRMLWSLLPYLPLGLLAGLLSGLLGIGGGLVFSPLLLLAGLDPYQALATSTLAIVPTTLGGTWAHLRNRSLPWRGSLAIVLGASLGAGLFSQVGLVLHGWMLLAMQALMYGGLALSFRPPSAQAAIGELNARVGKPTWEPRKYDTGGVGSKDSWRGKPSASGATER